MLSKTHFYVFLLILGVLVLFNLPVQTARSVKAVLRDLMAPYQSLWSSRWGNASGPKGGRSEGRENELVDSLGECRAQLEALERENRSLRELLDLKKRLGNRTIACRVIARDGALGWWRSVRVDRGSRSGLRPGNAVLAGGGVAGVIQETGPHTAEVLLISDPIFYVSVRCSRTDALGIVRGGGAVARAGLLEALWPVRPPEFLYADRDEELLEGDFLVTSGLGGIFPPGLPVGRIRRFHLAESGLYQEGVVEPFAPLDRLDFVLVLVTDTPEEEEASP